MSSERLRTTRVIVWTVVGLGTATVLWAVPDAIRFARDEATGGFWAMALAALLVDLPLFGLVRREDLRVRSTLSVCFVFAIFMLWGAAPVIVVQAIAGAITVVGQRYHPGAGLYLISRLVLASAAAELAVTLVDGRPLATAGTGLDGADLLTFVGLGLIWLAVNYGLLAAARATVRSGGLRQATAEVRVDLFGTVASILLVSPLLTAISGWWVLIVGVPLFVWNTIVREQMLQERQLGREPVSGVLNRQGLVLGMQALTALDTIDREGPRPLGVVVVSADAFLGINRMLGRDLYEKVVAAASLRLVEVFGTDRVGRLSGEGLVVLLPDLTEAEAIAEAEKAVAALAAPIEVDEIPFTLDPTAGVSLSPRHGRELTTLFMKAEIAAGEARRRGLRSMVYVRQAAEMAQRRIALLRELRTALDDPARHGEITVVYQPQVELGTGRLAGVEALVRWTHPQWGPVPTDELIDAIEASEVMHMLTRHVVQIVAAQMRVWTGEGHPLRTAVNVSVQDLHEPGFVDEIGEVIRTHGLEASHLTVEITERMLMTDAPLVEQICTELVKLGVGLSLDDFGTGYASMQQLRQLPLTEVKIDRSYVKGVVDNPADQAIIRSVHQLAWALGVDVVAEGVEDEATARRLAELPGTIGQGYYFGRPMTTDALQEWRQAHETGGDVAASSPGHGARQLKRGS